MPSTITTPYMNLVLPVVGAELGPQWATDINTAITRVDGHTHASGYGVQITPAGMNISSDLTFGGNNATALRSARFAAQGAPISGVADLGCLYFSGNDLWANDVAGNQIQITAGGVINTSALVSSTWATQSISTDVTIAPSNTKIAFLVDLTAPHTITLPSSSAVDAGRFYVFIDSGGFSEVNALTIAPAGSDTIAGAAASIALRAAKGFWALVNDGAGNWFLWRSGSELNGASVPHGGSLTIGNVPQVISPNQLNYGPINLAGGANYVANVLPAANLGLATTGQSGAVQLTHDLGGTATAPVVLGLSGSSGNPLVLGSANPASLQLGGSATSSVFWLNSTSAPSLGVQALTSSGAPPTWLLYGSDHDTGSTGRGGHVILQTGNSHGASGGDTNIQGQFTVRMGGSSGSPIFQLGEVVTSRVVIGLGNAVSSSDVTTGNKIVWISNGTAPTVGSATGAQLFSSGGVLGVLSNGGKVIKFTGAVTTAFSAGAVPMPTLIDGLMTINVDGTDYLLPLVRP